MGKTFHYPRLFRALSNLALNTSKDETSTTSLGKLFQYLTPLICIFIIDLLIYKRKKKVIKPAEEEVAIISIIAPNFFYYLLEEGTCYYSL